MRAHLMAGLCVLLTAGVVSAAPPEPPRVVNAEPAPEWTARFARTDGWIGADGAYSVPVSATRTLWLFGDTWVGAIRGGRRAGAAMVNNTVGVQDGVGAAAKIAFPIPRTAAGKPASLIVPADGRGWFWPQAGAHHDGRLVLFLSQLEKAEGTDAFGFKHVGQWLGVVDHPAADPPAWTVTQKRIPFGEHSAKRTRSYGSATLAHGGHLYVYGVDEPAKAKIGEKRMVVARVPAGKADDFAAWRFYRGGRWEADEGTPDPLAGGLASEYSVSYLPKFKQFVAVYTDSGLSDRIVARFAAAPEGPWSEPVLLYQSPEMGADKKLFTYAAKAHPHLSGDSELLVSYCVNSYDFARLVNDATLYWPKFVRVTLK